MLIAESYPHYADEPLQQGLPWGQKKVAIVESGRYWRFDCEV